MVKFKTVRQFSAESGYTEEAIRAKIKTGVWLCRRCYESAGFWGLARSVPEILCRAVRARKGSRVRFACVD
jgi:hypothetical protein